MCPVQKNIPSILPDIILKVRQKQELTREEHLLYLIHIKGMTEDEATKLIDKKKMNKPYNNTN